MSSKMFDVVIVEGIMVLHFEEISSEYLDIVRHRHNEFVEPSKWYADIIINGSNTTENSIDVVRKWLIK